MSEDVNSYQVGGKHYAKGYQHWDWVHDVLDDSYHLGGATKYLVRWRDKNGLQDLIKAGHYMRKIKVLDSKYPRGTPSRRWDDFLERQWDNNSEIAVLTLRFCESNELEAMETSFMVLVAQGRFDDATAVLGNLITFATVQGYSAEGFAVVNEIGKPVHPKFVWEGFTDDKCEWQCCKCHAHVTSIIFTKPGTATDSKYAVPFCARCAAKEAELVAGATPAYVNQDPPTTTRVVDGEFKEIPR